jgi:hypothetical protein
VTPDPLTPTAGARYVLERVGVDGRAASYRARILTPDATYAYDAQLSADAEPALSSGAAAPAELEKVLVMIARLTARAVDKRMEEGLPAWPERITRWRGPGRGR